jgi:hypothetical protein
MSTSGESLPVTVATVAEGRTVLHEVREWLTQCLPDAQFIQMGSHNPNDKYLTGQDIILDGSITTVY